MTLASTLLTTAASLAETSSKCIDAASALLGGSAIPDAPAASSGPAAVDYFPADPGSAPFPSPENSTLIVLGGKASGPPYLRDAQGGIWRWSRDAAGNLIRVTSAYSPLDFWQAEVNGMAIAGVALSQLIVRQGQVYLSYDGAATGQLESFDNPVSGIQRAALPPAFTSTGSSAGGGTVPLPPMPALPPILMPATTGKIILFGTAPALWGTPQAAHDHASPGDTISPTPDLVGQTRSWTLSISTPIVVDFLGRLTGAGTETPTWHPGLIIDATAADLPKHLGAIVPLTDCVVRGIEVFGAGIGEPEAGGTAAVRIGDCPSANVWLDHAYLHGNQNGVGPSGSPHTMRRTNVWEKDNGLGAKDPNPGRTHNDYSEGVYQEYGPGYTSTVAPGFLGHATKCRANSAKFIEPFFLWSPDSSSLDVPSGSTAIVKVGAGTISKKAGDANHTVVGYGVENPTNGLAGIEFDGTTIDAECESPSINSAGPLAFNKAIFKGTKPDFGRAVVTTT